MAKFDLTKYKHIEWTDTPNKKLIPINHFTFEKVDSFNKIYQFCKNKYMLVKPTKSRGIPYDGPNKYHSRYFMLTGNERFELVVVCPLGCYRFLLQAKKSETNRITGSQACREIFKQAKKYNIDFSQYLVEDGLKVKEGIVSPSIEVLEPIFLEKDLYSVHHIDLNSSYASRIVEAHPELRQMYEELYAKRKIKNDYYKHVLTNSIGCFQSEFCVDPANGFKVKPYALAELAKIAVNGTREKIDNLVAKLRATKRIPLLTNTDGIWYYGSIYHDEDEGLNLGQWKHDHLNCRFLMMGPGAYQYVEDGKCNTVVRGICNLDALEPDREKWAYGSIRELKTLTVYLFDPDKGVIRNEETG